MSYLQKIDWKSLSITKEIGKGGFATVYLGQWQGSNVAVKQLNVSHLPTDLSGDFEREASIHAQCNFPRIVRLFGITQEPGHFALVMEYCPRGSLYDALHDASIDLPWDKRWEIAIDVGAGLAYLHGAKILHQDLKSLNVLLDAEMHPKITDFGQSKVKMHTATSTAQASKATGTVRWNAPETLKRGYKPTESADMYSYGMILWEIASRALPFADAQNDSIIISWLKDGEKETIPEDCPPEFAYVINGAWQDAPARPTASQLHALLESTRPAPSIAALSLATPKSWHFDSQHRSSGVNEQGYELFEAGQSDMDKVVQSYFQHPVEGYDIARVEVIHNPDLNRKFAAQLNLLEKRHGKPAFAPKWQADNNPVQRAQIDALHQQMSAPYIDPDAPHVRLMPLWHATRPDIVPSLLETGFAALGTTDDGFFGQGIYSAAEAEYSYRVYGTSNYTRPGALLMNWVASFSAYPVIDGDMPKLKGRGAYKGGYDAHFIPVTPKNPSNPREVNYFPCQAGQPHTYREMVVFDAASCLPRYLVHLQPSLRKHPGVIPIVPKPVGVTPVMPAINQPQVNQLLQHVAYGEQDQAEALIRTNPSLLLGKGTVTDYSNRTFTHITAFQLALWAYDWHMWQMLTRYLPQANARDQLRELESQGTAYGKHYDFNDLLNPYKTYLDNFQAWDWSKRHSHWNTVIGKAQTRVPSHVANEYCRPDRSFDPTPSFKEPTLPRTFKFYEDEGVWYPLGKMRYGFLGVDFGVFRPVGRWLLSPTTRSGPRVFVGGHGAIGFSALAELCKVRTAQYEELKALLR